MKKKILVLIMSFSALCLMQAQVGINTQAPRTTLHVLPTSTAAGSAEGIIAPNLTKAQLVSKDADYNATETGAIVYVADATGVGTAKTVNVTKAGYYYFDGSVWNWFANTLGADNGLGVVSDKVELGGALNKATTITQGANTLNFNSTANNAFNVNGAISVSGDKTTLGGRFAPGDGALIDIKSINNINGGETSTTGGVVMPRVNLVSENSLAPFIAGGGTNAEKLQHRGMQVYHLGNATMEQGMYVWTGASWVRYLTQLPVITSNVYTLDGPYETPDAEEPTLSNPATWRRMSFGESSMPAGQRRIIIREDGSYTFVLRLYGRARSKLHASGVQTFYYYAFVNNSNVARDAAEVPTTTAAYGRNTDTQMYAHFMGKIVQLTVKDLKAGDEVAFVCRSGGSFYMNPANGNMWTIRHELWEWEGGGDNNSTSPVRSSVVYWKL